MIPGTSPRPADVPGRQKSGATSDAVGERLQKALSRAGLGSRREVETWISAGRVIVNGKPAELGQRVTSKDKVTVDGKPVVASRLFPTRQTTIGYHKPVGEICTRKDPEGRPTIYQSLPQRDQARWVSVGRLDINTSGLLLLTTDGRLADALMHPSHQVEREYAVRVLGQASLDQLKALTTGVTLEDGEARFNQVVHVGGTGINQWYHVVLCEGRQREVRRLWEAVGLTVSRLIRVRYGNVLLPRDKPAGRWWELGPHEVAELYRLAGLEQTKEKPAAERPRRPLKRRVPAARTPARRKPR
ncbi:MAG: pseudouridine synthase [Gammaproteobacteria bacterium]|nr:pseudouridine synthase [Gammaproteobacteria bacterium]